MEAASQQSLDRLPISSRGDRAAELHNLTEQPLMPKDERITPANPSADAAISVASRSRNAKDRPENLKASGTVTTMYQFNTYTPQEQGFFNGGYDNGSGNWDEHSHHVNANNLHVVPPAMYNDSPLLFIPPSYGFDSQMPYGQFSAFAGPISPIMIDGQLFSPHQIPVSLSYYQPPVSPSPSYVNSALQVSQTHLMPPGSSGQENFIDNAPFGPGSGYYLPFVSFGGGDLSGSSGMGLYRFPGEFGSGETLPNRSSPLDSVRLASPLSSGVIYPQSIGILGSYEQNAPQAPFQGYGSTSNSSSRHYPHSGSYQSTGGSISNRNQFIADRGRRNERDRDSVSITTDTLGILSDRNRGPRALKPKGKNSIGEGSTTGIHKDVGSASGFHIDQLNSPDFITDHRNAKFFVLKSFSEDNVHKSVKYGVWASTPLGNRKLDAAYRDANEMEGTCPVFLFFSVNASGQFCGAAEMVGPVDFEKDADYWHQDRWSGQFPVKWHFIKDVANSCFRHILLDNNDNKPVTHSRDSQEVKLEHGIEILKIFKNHDVDTSLLDDFKYYDEREKSVLERKAKQRTSSTGNAASALAAESVNLLSDNLADTLRLDSSKNLSKTDIQ